MADQTPDPIDVLLSTTINWNPLNRSAGRDDPHKEHNYSGSCALCRMDRPESLPAIFAALTEAGFEVRPVVDDATRQEVPGLTPEWLTRMASACRNVQEQAQPKNVEWFNWVPEALDRAAAYLGESDR